MKPSLQFSIPCFQVREDEGKPPSFEFIFYELPFPRFPFPPREDDPEHEKYKDRWTNWGFFVANGWCNGKGDFIQSMQIVKPDKKTVLVATGDQPFTLADNNTPFMAINFFQGIRFEEAGIHWIQVFLNNELVLEYPLTIRKAETGV